MADRKAMSELFAQDLLAPDDYSSFGMRALPDPARAAPAAFGAPGGPPAAYSGPLPTVSLSGTNLRTPYASGSLTVPTPAGDLTLRGNKQIGSPGYGVGFSLRQRY